jgi:GT2 family glycosyltransferase
VEMTVRTGQIALAHDSFCYLSRAGSDRIMAGDRGAWESLVEWSLTCSHSSMVAVPRDLFDRVGGFDPGFIGWGMEDVAFYLATRAVGGGAQRVTGPVWHLWHPPSPEAKHTPAYDANVRRLRDYEEHASSPDAMLELLRRLERI